MTFNKEKALEAAKAKIERQNKTLKETLDEIDYVEKNAPNSQALINQLKIKRGRQQQAVAATQELIDLYSKKAR